MHADTHQILQEVSASETNPSSIVTSDQSPSPSSSNVVSNLMTEMPLDTLLEIFDQLEPLDLLHLSWSSKSLNAIIMGKAARFLWDTGSFSDHIVLMKNSDIGFHKIICFGKSTSALSCRS